MNKLFNHFRLSNRIVRLKIQGPINHTSQLQITQRLNHIQSLQSDALLVVINSFGGSLQSAKNISARIKKLSINNQIPIYCFAQQFCLNSANLLLTTGTKCFAHKFSIIGDFGYVYQGIDTKELQNLIGFKQHHITSMKMLNQQINQPNQPKQQKQSHNIQPQYKTNILTQCISSMNKKLITKILKQSQQNLKQQILINRFNSLNKLQQQKQFIQFMKNDGFYDLSKCVQNGLIDGIGGIQQWIIQNHKQSKIIQGTGKQFQNPIIDWIRSTKQSFKYKD